MHTLLEARDRNLVQSTGGLMNWQGDQLGHGCQPEPVDKGTLRAAGGDSGINVLRNGSAAGRRNEEVPLSKTLALV